MAELKTTENEADVSDFLNLVENPQRKADCNKLLEIMTTVTGQKARMWGDSIVGFGKYRYKYQTGKEGDWFFVGFSPRKQNLTIYIIAGFSPFEEILSKIGKHKKSSSCLYVNKLSDLDEELLKEMISKSIAIMKERNP